MKVIPLHDWTIIKRHDPKEKTASGIIIPDSAQDIPAEGTVVAIGPGRYKKEEGRKTRFIPTILKPGQKVYFMEYATQEIELEGKEIIFIREEDILGTFEDDRQLMVKESHPIEAKQEQPLLSRATAAISPLIPPSKKEVKKKKPAKKKPARKEKAVSKLHKPTTKTKKPSKKATLKKTSKKSLKKKTASGTKKKTKTSKKTVKRSVKKSVKAKKATPIKKSGKRSGKKK